MDRGQGIARVLAAGTAAVLTAAVATSASGAGEDPVRRAAQAAEAPPPAPPPPPAARELKNSLGREGSVTMDPETRRPGSVSRGDGLLTGPSEKPAEDVVRGWLRNQRDLYRVSDAEIAGLRVVRRYVSRGTVVHLAFEQTIGGLPVLGATLTANVTSGGRLANVSGSPVPGLKPADTQPEVNGGAALLRAKGRSSSRKQPGTAAPEPRFRGGRRAKLALMPGEDGRTRLVWRTIHDGPRGTVDSLVDANTGAVLRRRSLTKSLTAQVFDQYPGAAAGGDQEVQEIGQWRPDPATPAEDFGLLGPNAFVFADVNDSDSFTAAELIAPDNTDNFEHDYTPFPGVTGGNCPPSPYHCSWDFNTGSSWLTNLNQAGTQLFWYLNLFHDHLKSSPIEFVPQKGNFEDEDPVWGNVDVGANGPGNLPPVPDDANDGTVNNAFYSEAPDGSSPRIAASLFRPLQPGDPTPTINVADDASVMYHEYTHGLSTRLVADSDGLGALRRHQSSSIGEATSDWYAGDFIVGQGLQTDTATAGEVILGGYAGTDPGGFRHQPIDCAVGASATACPAPPGGAGAGGYTYADMGQVELSPESHEDGTIWAQTLWDLRRALIASHGGPLGLDKARLLVTAGLELSPQEPTFLEMRNAILLADELYNNGADHDGIWQVFADRGMGFFASTVSPSDADPVENFQVPPSGAAGQVSGVVRTPGGAPVADAFVYVPGNGGGTTSDLTDTTDAAGTYSISAPPGTYPQLVVAPIGGHDPATATNVAIPAGGQVTRDITLTRNWAAAAAGATIDSSSASLRQCNADLAIDQDLDIGWLTASPVSSAAPGPKSFVIKLPETVDVSTFAIDPANPCSTGRTAALGSFRIDVSEDNLSFRTVAQGTFGTGNLRKKNVVTPSSSAARTRYVRLTGLASQATAAGQSGRRFMGVMELQVYGSPSSGPVDTEAPETTITDGPSGTVQSSTVRFAFTSSEPGSTFECSLDGIGYSVCNGPVEISQLANGNHSFAVRARDGAGNADPSPASRSFTVSVRGGPPPGPVLVVSVPKSLKLSGTGVSIRAGCGAVACTISAAGRASYGGRAARTLKARGVSRRLGPGQSTLLKLRFTKATVRELKRALRRKRKVTVRIRVDAVDATGRHATRRYSSRLRAPCCGSR